MDNTVYSGKFKYYLQPNEVATYTKRYVDKFGRIDIHRFEYWLNNYFMNLHQTTFSQAVAIVSASDKNYTEKDYIELLKDLETKNADPQYSCLGIENQVRLKSFARLLDEYRERNRSKQK